MDMQRLMAQAKKMQNSIASAEKELDETVYEGASGSDNAVIIRINSKHEVQEVVIADDLMDRENKEMLQDLITVAFGKAEEKLAADREAKMGAITGGVSFPGM